MSHENTAKEPQRRDKRWFVLVIPSSIWKKEQALMAFGPFHKRDQAVSWVKEKLNPKCSHQIMHMEAP